MPDERTEVNPAPCRTDAGCPKGTPENSKSLSPRNHLVYQHWKECKAVGQFPDDEIVRKNAAIIQELVDQSKELKQIEMMSLMMTGKGI